MLVLWSHGNDRKSTRDKAKIGDPKVNRGCTPLTANRTSTDFVENSLATNRSSVQYSPLEVHHTGGLNAIYTSNRSKLITLFKMLNFDDLGNRGMPRLNIVLIYTLRVFCYSLNPLCSNIAVYSKAFSHIVQNLAVNCFMHIINTMWNT